MAAAAPRRLRGGEKDQLQEELDQPQRVGMPAGRNIPACGRGDDTAHSGMAGGSAREAFSLFVLRFLLRVVQPVVCRRLLVHRQHMGAEKRSVNREFRRSDLNDESENLLAKRLASNFSGPAEHAVRCETRRRVRAALQLLSDRDREILELRYLDQMAPQEIAATLGIGRGAVGTRHFRAIQKLKKLLEVE